MSAIALDIHGQLSSNLESDLHHVWEFQFSYNPLIKPYGLPR